MIKDINWSWRPYQKDCFNSIYEFFTKKKITKQLVVQATGCHAKGQGILMHDGSVKLVEDICVGDSLMGNDSSARNVLNLYRGKEEMARIVPIKGDPFVVNLSHILSLRKTPTPRKYPGMNKFVNISVKDYLQKGNNFKHLYKLYRTEINFNTDFYSKYNHIDPYLVGLWLGDGKTGYPHIISNEPEVEQYLIETGNLKNKHHKGNGLYNYSLGKGLILRSAENLIYTELKQFLQKGSKYVNISQLTLLKQQRLEILAGLIDSDGYIIDNCYDFINKNESIADAVVFLSRSLGLAAYKHACKKRCVNTNVWGNYFRVYISGNTEIIPCKVTRKKARKRKQIKDVLTTGFKVEILSKDDYYGFELDGNHLYCLNDFTVTHNTGKRMGAVNVAGKFRNNLFLAHSEELIAQAVKDFEKHYGFMNVGVVKGPRFEVDKQIVIASPQTMINRLDRINPQHFDLVQIDEAHRYLSRTFCKVVNHFTPRLRIGWTATPYRLDGLSLSNLFDDIVFEYNIDKGISDGFLCELDGIRIKTEIDISKVHKQAGDFSIGELSSIVDTPARNQLIVESYKKYADGRQAAGFCVDIQHCINLKQEFIKHGITCDILVSDESISPDRPGIDRRFRNKEITVLLNVQILTEGYDYNDIGAVLMIRPTQSLTFYMQAIGRGTRLKSPEFRTRFGLNDCKILDFVDNSGKHNLINTWTLDQGKDTKAKTFLSTEKRDKLFEIEDERARRNAKIIGSVTKDSKINLLKLPLVKTYGGEWTKDYATEKQVEYLKKLGFWQEGVEYTKGMCSELITSAPAASWQIQKLAKWGYDVSGGNISNGQYQMIWQKLVSDNKFNPSFKP